MFKRDADEAEKIYAGADIIPDLLQNWTVQPNQFRHLFIFKISCIACCYLHIISDRMHKLL